MIYLMSCAYVPTSYCVISYAINKLFDFHSCDIGFEGQDGGGRGREMEEKFAHEDDFFFVIFLYHS